MRNVRVLERMRPLLAPLRKMLVEHPDYRTTWPDCVTSAGETYIHCVAAIMVRRNPRLGERRMIEQMLSMTEHGNWLAGLTHALDTYVVRMKDTTVSRNNVRTYDLRTDDDILWGRLAMHPSKALVTVLTRADEPLPLWLSRSSPIPLIDPEAEVELTAERMKECIAMMRRQLALAGLADADVREVAIGADHRRIGGERSAAGFTAYDASTRIGAGCWSEDPTSIAVEIPDEDLTIDGKALHLSSMCACSIMHGPTHELVHELNRIANMVAAVVISRERLTKQVTGVRKLIQSEGTRPGGPKGGIILDHRIRQAGTCIQLECTTMAYDPDSFRMISKESRFIGHDVDAVARAFKTDMTFLTREYARIRRMAGVDPFLNGDDLDLAPYAIDIPLAHLINRRMPGRLREIAVGLIVNGQVPEFARPGWPGPMEGVVIGLDAGRIRGRMDLGPGVAWAEGKIRLASTMLPASVKSAMVGEPVSSVVAHDLLTDDLIISGTSIRTLGGGDEVTYLHFADATMRLTKALASLP